MSLNRTPVLLLFLATFASPVQAGFAQPVQLVQLAYGQKQARVIFQADSPITHSRSLCDCTKVKHGGNTLTAVVDVSDFAQSTQKQLEATTADGKTTRLTMDIRVPQAVQLSARSMIWKVGGACSPKKLQVIIPKGSPVHALTSADLSGDAFDYTTNTTNPGELYSLTVSPRSTQKSVLNRLIIRTDSADARYAGYIIYLSIQP